MKNSKPSSSSSHKPHSSSNRKSRWESSSDPKSSSALSDSKPSKSSNPKDSGQDISSSSTLVFTPAPGAVGGVGVHPPLPASPGGGASPFSAPAPPTYGFHNLERRTIVLADGSVRSYFALPPDYPLEPYGHGGRPEPGLGLGFDRRFSPDGFREPPMRDYGGPQRDYWPSFDGPRAPQESGPLKRKFPEDDELTWRRQHVMQYGNPSANSNPNFSLSSDRSPPRRGYEEDSLAGSNPQASKRVRVVEDSPGPADAAATLDVDPQALKRAFLKFAKTINESAGQRKNYLEDGRNGPLQCIVCGRASKEFTDVHGLIMHAYSSPNPDLHVDHLGLHKALCILMGWNYAKAPENSKAYQSLSIDVASANSEDLILWPPTVIIHNTNSGKRKDGRMEGMGNKEMDMKLKDLGFGGGKSKSLYGKEGHLGITVVKFANTQSGLKEAERLAEYFEKDNHGCNGWARAQASQSGGDEEKNPALVKVDPKSGENKRIFYGYLATASDIEKVDFDMRKKAIIKSRREFDPSE